MLFFDEHFSKVTFIANDMGILGVDLDKINFDDDNNFQEDNPEIIIHAKILAWHSKFEQPKARKERYYHILFYRHFLFFSNLKLAWHPTRWWDWCLSKDKKKSSGANFYWEVLEVLLVPVGSV